MSYSQAINIHNITVLAKHEWYQSHGSMEKGRDVFTTPRTCWHCVKYKQIFPILVKTVSTIIIYLSGKGLHFSSVPHIGDYNILTRYWGDFKPQALTYMYFTERGDSNSAE